MMRNIQRAKNTCFLWALALSVGFPAGILMIILGFTKGMLYVAIPGIVLTVVGFYVMPMLWVSFGSYRYRCALYQQIVSDGIRRISLLSEMNGKEPKQTAQDVRWLITNRYLTGYVILDNETVVNKNEVGDLESYVAQQTGDMQTVKCPSCGADAELVGGVGSCPYCGRRIAKERTAGK